MDDYGVRSTEGWHWYVTLALLAVMRAAELDRHTPKKSPETHSLSTFRWSRGLAAA